MPAAKRRKKGKWADRPERDRMAFEVLHAIRGISPQEISRKATKAGFAVSAQSVRNLRADPKHGGTRFPQCYTLQAMLSAIGKGFVFGDTEQPKQRGRIPRVKPTFVPAGMQMN